ncbi:hypothetical protein [Flammeovirga sp. EKP202]|uniref:hypothetical protein n=1 Tax=Flammeovirga sp. EKP202 TaxID=2770592 RepID=UPI00166002AD|nr:hypothetical protein [Flammeovirga sp. EKP202]MBD0405290.1 hypothetical protein [Flammeovirga sp. EKP202]
MKVLIPFLFLFTACNVQHSQKEVAEEQDQWRYEAHQSTLKMHDNPCLITIKAIPDSHELIYTINYEGEGYLEPLVLSTIDSRPSAHLISERVWVENDTTISHTIRPHNNTLKYAQIKDKGPLRGSYMISYQEKGQLQHLRFQLDSKVYNYYLETFPYVSNQKSYHLSPKNLTLEEKISAHLKEKLKSKRDNRGAEGIIISENELNVAGLISHVDCIYDGKTLNLTITWINHTELDLWITSPVPHLYIDQQKEAVAWTSFNEKIGLAKGKRISINTNLELDNAPNEIKLPIENVLFYDEDVFFPEKMEVILNGELSI